MLEIGDSDQEEIRQVAECIYPYECCGFLIGRIEEGVKLVDRIRVAENRRYDSPANRFLITPDQFRELEDELRLTSDQILGFFHSHPDVAARPSSYDLDHAWPWYSYVIVSVKKGSADDFKSWRLEEDRSSFLEEKISSPVEPDRSNLESN
jgi:proteasome lid subunit RPN8/RPN11